MRRGMEPKLAAKDAISRIARKFPDFVGAVFAIDRNGVHAGACYGWTFQYSVRSPDMDDVKVFTVHPDSLLWWMISRKFLLFIFYHVSALIPACLQVIYLKKKKKRNWYMIEEFSSGWAWRSSWMIEQFFSNVEGFLDIHFNFDSMILITVFLTHKRTKSSATWHLKVIN